MNNNAIRTNIVVVCAVLAAVVVALNFIASLHIVRLDAVFYLIGGALVYFAAKLYGSGQGAALYAAASLLSFLIVPDKLWLLMFICVFGPAAILQTVLEKRIGYRVSAALTIVVFVLLFYFFGFVIVYGGGFVPYISLPATGLPVQIAALCFAAFSAVIACIVNRGLYSLLTDRLKGLFGAGAAGTKTTYPDPFNETKQPVKIILPSYPKR